MTLGELLDAGPIVRRPWRSLPERPRRGDRIQSISLARADEDPDQLLAAAGGESDLSRATELYRRAMETLNADVPAIFLYAPSNTAVVSRRIENVEIDPYSWASGLRTWRATAPATA